MIKRDQAKACAELIEAKAKSINSKDVPIINTLRSGAG